MAEYKDPKSVNYDRYAHKRYILGTQSNGVTKEVTLGTWSGEARLDIRKWDEYKLGKGISLTADEVRRLRDALNEIDFGR